MVVGGWWSATSEMTWTCLAQDATMEIGLSWVPTSKDKGQLVGKGVIFHEIEPNGMHLPNHLQNQLTQIYIPTGGHLLQSQALRVSRHHVELPKEHQVFEVSVAELPSNVWGESTSKDWQIVRFKPCKEEQKEDPPWWKPERLQEFLKNGCACYSSVPQDEES